MLTRLRCTLFALLWSAMAAYATLPIGAVAPSFTATAALAGQAFEFDMAAALKKGPVVLYFFPKAFTHGCTIEANAFAQAMPQFTAAGATVLGMSHDEIDTLKRFSTEACRGQFAVASDPKTRTIRAYAAAAAANPHRANRISYVVAPSGKVVLALDSTDPYQHVEQTLSAVQKLQGK